MAQTAARLLGPVTPAGWYASGSFGAEVDFTPARGQWASFSPVTVSPLDCVCPGAAPKPPRRVRSAPSDKTSTWPPAPRQQHGAYTHEHQRIRLRLRYGSGHIAGEHSYGMRLEAL